MNVSTHSFHSDDYKRRVSCLRGVGGDDAHGRRPLGALARGGCHPRLFGLQVYNQELQKWRPYKFTHVFDHKYLIFSGKEKDPFMTIRSLRWRAQPTCPCRSIRAK